LSPTGCIHPGSLAKGPPYLLQVNVVGEALLVTFTVKTTRPLAGNN